MISTDSILQNTVQLKNIYLSLIVCSLEHAITSVFNEICMYCNFDETIYNKIFNRISKNISDDEIKIEISKIIKKTKYYEKYITAIFKCYMIFMTFGLSTKLLDEKFYNKINIVKFTKRCYQNYIFYKSSKSTSEIIENTILEFLPLKFISTNFIEMPITKKECYDKIRAQMNTRNK